MEAPAKHDLKPDPLLRFKILSENFRRMGHTTIMNGPYDRTAFLAEFPVRAEIALACSMGPATKSQIGRCLKRHPGSLTAIETLEKVGVLRRADSPSQRGAPNQPVRWSLDPSWRGAAQEAADQVKVGILSAGIDLVLVPNTDVAAACGIFSSPSSLVAWGAPLQGEQIGLILCPASEPDEKKTLDLLGELGKLGLRPARVRLPFVMDRDQLANWASGILGSSKGLPISGV